MKEAKIWIEMHNKWGQRNGMLGEGSNVNWVPVQRYGTLALGYLYKCTFYLSQTILSVRVYGLHFTLMSPLLITLAVLRGRVSCWGGYLSKVCKATVQGNSDEETCSKYTLRRENFPGGNPLQWWMQDAGKGGNETGGECRSGTFSNLTELQGLQRSTCSKVWISDWGTLPVSALSDLTAQHFCSATAAAKSYWAHTV